MLPLLAAGAAAAAGAALAGAAGLAAAGVLAGLNAGSHVIAVNVPAGSPRLEEADFVLNTLTAIDVSKASDGVVTVSLKM